MGWAYGEVDGREVGYSIEAECDQDGCTARINRGLAYCCGDMHGGTEHGCGRYFCTEHLFFTALGQQCCRYAAPFSGEGET